ncbi:VOC family protein [Xanthovirga aplysinae]|uniref:VOC family protein n=1 Tax=Xanthovirga aplysinae TaxID=2529853 RepID=UPI0031B643E2
MKFEHLALWVKDLEAAKHFYVKYFNMKCGEKYINPVKKFSSYFLSFESSETRLEIMHKPDILENQGDKGMSTGLTHFGYFCRK